MERLFRPTALRAGEVLQRAGEVATHPAFLTEGCLRSYVIDGKGKEHVVQFACGFLFVSARTELVAIRGIEP